MDFFFFAGFSADVSVSIPEPMSPEPIPGLVAGSGGTPSFERSEVAGGAASGAVSSDHVFGVMLKTKSAVIAIVRERERVRKGFEILMRFPLKGVAVGQL